MLIIIKSNSFGTNFFLWNEIAGGEITKHNKKKNKIKDTSRMPLFFFFNGQKILMF